MRFHAASFAGLLLCTCLIVLRCDAQPSSWLDAIAGAQLLYSPSEPTNPAQLPAIGNGYLSTIVHSDSVYVAGVFNGLLGTGPSHHARIPSTNAISVSGSTVGNAPASPVAVTAAGLDLLNGAYYLLSENQQISVSQTWYAHRSQQHLLVHELTLQPLVSGPITVYLSSNFGAPSTDIDFENITSLGAAPVASVMYGAITQPEIVGGEKISVAVVFTPVPASVVISASTTLYYITAITTNLDTDFTNNTNVVSNALTTYQTAVLEEKDLFAAHTTAWQELWYISGGGVELNNRLELAQAVNSSIYYIVSSIRDDRPYSLSPGGLPTNSYNAHTFWDAETWMFPPLLALYPDLAASMLQYRYDRMNTAHQKALSYDQGYTGTMFPWESAFTGFEVCPDGVGTGLREQHITGDIGFAVRQYWYATGNKTWLSGIGQPLINGIAEFWASRVENNGDGTFSINDVIGPDEYHDHVNDSIFTNTVAQISLEFAEQVNSFFGSSSPSNWSKIASGLVMPFDTTDNIHLEYDGYSGDTIKQADVVLLGFPLGVSMSDTVRLNDLIYYENRTDPNGPAMTWGMHAIGYLDMGLPQQAASNFNQSYQLNVQGPFCVWQETPQGGAVNFVTGAGGFLQGVIFGYAGMRITDNGFTFNPQFPEGVSQFKVRGVKYQGSSFSAEFEYFSKSMTLQLQTGSSLTAKLAAGTSITVGTKPVTVTLQPFVIS